MLEIFAREVFDFVGYFESRTKSVFDGVEYCLMLMKCLGVLLLGMQVADQEETKQKVILDQIKSLALQDENIEIVWLYGSRSNNTASKESDYDLAIAFRVFPEDEWELRLQPEMLAQKWANELNLSLHKLSIVDFNHIPLALALSIVNANSVLVAKDTLRLAREENRVSSMWELDQMYHRKQFG